MWKRIILFFVVALLAVATVVVYRASSLESRQLSPKSVQKITLSDDIYLNLSGAIRIPSISYESKEDRQGHEFDSLHRYIEAKFPLVHQKLKKEVINQYSLLYTWEGTNPQSKPLAILAHLDVVPVVNVPSEEWFEFKEKSKYLWQEAPFSGKITPDYIWGRGALDDKMNVFASLEAVEFLLEQNFQPEKSIYLVFGHDEEVGGAQGAKKIAEKLEKEGVELDFVLDEGLFILEDLMPGIQKPVAYVGVAEKGFVNLELKVKGQGGHSSRPPASTTIGVLSEALLKLENNPFPASLDGASEATFEYLVPEMDFGTRLIFANQWLFGSLILNQMQAKAASSAILRTTTAPTMLKASPKANVLPQEASAIVNFRIKPGETAQSVKERVQKIINNERVEVQIQNRGFDSNDPVAMSDIQSSAFKTLHSTIQASFPEVVVAPALMIAGTDSKHFKTLTKNIFRFSPVHLKENELDGFHGVNERLPKSAYENSICFYVELMKNLK